MFRDGELHLSVDTRYTALVLRKLEAFSEKRAGWDEHHSECSVSFKSDMSASQVYMRVSNYC